MAAHYVPSSNLPVEQGRDPTSVGYPQAYPGMTWGGSQPPEEPGIPWRRYFSALKRYKWLILLIIIAGTAVGFGATRLMAPEYQANGVIWISDDMRAGRQGGSGPVRGEDLLFPTSWPDLLKSSVVMENVVRSLQLYIWPANPADSAVFAEFQPGPGFRAGTYLLKVDGARYTLATPQGVVLEQGAVGDSIGRSVGFQWHPAPATLTPARQIEFTAVNPNTISTGLLRTLDVNLPQGSQFMRLSMTGRSPRRTARILNQVMVELVGKAGDLKRQNIRLEERTLVEQLDSAKRALDASQAQLEAYKKNTITLPGEGGTGLPSGTMPGMSGGFGNPVVDNYFVLKLQSDALRRDREALETILRNPSGITPESFLSIEAAKSSPDLQTALGNLTKREAALRAAREQYTDEHRLVQDLKQQVEQTRTVEVPLMARRLISALADQERNLDARLASAAGDLKGIPQRQLKMLQLSTDAEQRANLYTMLGNRLAQLKLEELSAIPDISILDTAVAPLFPTKNTAPNIIFLAVIASLGGAIGLALLLDHTDPRFRYPEQVTDELGLTILGAVPTIKRAHAGEPDPEEAAQVIESFRTIRMALTNQYDSVGPISFTVSSPGPGDGKSLVASNLALSFAEAGYRTVLLDGDTRRGQLHAMFGAPRRPGLLDFLGGDVPLENILRTTTHERLTLIPCGTRRHRGPELLHSQAMTQLMSDLRRRYDVILIDSPPLGAGVDPFVLATASGNILLVLRRGTTDRKMAETKLKLLERLPLRILGAVLNDIRAEGQYKYYSYLYGYTTSEDDELPRIAPQVGELTAQT